MFLLRRGEQAGSPVEPAQLPVMLPGGRRLLIAKKLQMTNTAKAAKAKVKKVKGKIMGRRPKPGCWSLSSARHHKTTRDARCDGYVAFHESSRLTGRIDESYLVLKTAKIPKPCSGEKMSSPGSQAWPFSPWKATLVTLLYFCHLALSRPPTPRLLAAS